MERKKQSRLRRARKARAQIRELGYVRLCVHKTNKHIYAQIIRSSVDGDQVIVACSSRQGIGGKNMESAVSIGRIVAEKAKEKGITQVAFDRSGYQYHGRIQGIADAAREAGLEF